MNIQIIYPFGFTPMPMYPAGMQEGQIVRDQASGAIYKLAGGFKHHYPNMGTYSAHGSPPSTNYDQYVLMGIPTGPNVYPPGLFEGQVVRDQSSGAIYKLVNGFKCHYPDMPSYTSHGSPPFTNFDSGILANLVDGPKMNAAGIVEGAIIRDNKSGAIYIMKHGHKHHYPNMGVYGAHGSPAYKDYDPSVLQNIPNGIPVLPPGYYEGQVIRNPQSGAIYRICGGKKCHYPNMQVYQMHGSPAYKDCDVNMLNNIPDGAAY